MLEQNIYPNRIRMVLAQKLNVAKTTILRWVTNNVQSSKAQFIEIQKHLRVNLNNLFENMMSI